MPSPGEPTGPSDRAHRLLTAHGRPSADPDLQRLIRQAALAAFDRGLTGTHPPQHPTPSDIRAELAELFGLDEWARPQEQPPEEATP